MTRPRLFVPPKSLAFIAIVAGFVFLTLALNVFSSSARADESAGSETATGSRGDAPLEDGFQVTIEIREVAEDGSETQLDRHLVVFREGRVYDFRTVAPRDITVVDVAEGRVTLLSRKRHVKSTLATQDLVKAAARVRLFAKQEGLEDRLGLEADVKFNQIALVSGEREPAYEVAFAGFDYDVQAEMPASPTQSARFAEFTDWVARVNLIRKLGTPPFARMKLGRRIAADGLVPSTVTLRFGPADQRRTLRAVHTFADRLSDESAERIDEVTEMLTLYQEVPLESLPR